MKQCENCVLIAELKKVIETKELLITELRKTPQKKKNRFRNIYRINPN